jgi:hypothetical protein
VSSDAEGGGWQGPDATGGDTGSDGSGSNDAGPSDSSGAEGSTTTDSGGSDASDASDSGGIIIGVEDSGDDGPGAVEGGATTYFHCGPGPTTCKTQTQFCLHSTFSDGGETWGCSTIPSACEPAPTCACLSTMPSVTNGCPCTPQVGLQVDCTFH